MSTFFDTTAYEDLVRNSTVLFAYKGPLTNELLAEFSHDLRRRLKVQENKKSVSTKVFAIFMELAQNILFYSKQSDSFDGSDKIGAILITQTDEHYKVLTGNVVANEAAGRLISKAEKINALDREALRELKREQRSAAPEADSKGAGIGLIHVALTSDNLVEIDIQKLDDNFSFYMVGANISRT